MSSQSGVGLPEALERAASALPEQADAIRPANGDPTQLIELLDTASASRVLRWLLVEESADGAELIDEWLDVSDRGAAAVLGVDAEGLPKPARKALRRAHHQLRSRGVSIPDAAPAPTVAKLPKLEEALDEAVLSPLDPRGGRAAYLVQSQAQGGVRMFEVLFNDAYGILDCRAYETGRSKVRKFLRQFERRGALAALPVPPAAVRALIERAAAAHPTNRPLPRAFLESRGQIGRAPAGAQTPGERVREALAAAEPAAEPQRAADLVRSGEIGPWPPTGDALRSLAEALDAVATSSLVLSPEQRHQQMRALVDGAIPDLFSAAHAETTAARFEETAYVFWQREREGDARACLAAAAAFRAGDAAANDVARAMLEATLAGIFQKAEVDAPATPAGPDAPR